jgi:hypothetical protein
MRKLFEYFEAKGINKDNIEEIIGNWNPDQLDRILDEVHNIIETANTTESSSRFSFTANSELSGDAFPCAALDCRMKSAVQIAKFAALYSDSVRIINPFDKYNGIVQFDVSDIILSQAVN